MEERNAEETRETPTVLTQEMIERINANRLAALERKRLREQAEKELLRPEEERAIKQHLKSSNRPFNANNLIDEFARKYKKSNVLKALQSLEDSREIQVKMFKKIKIYLADQSQFPTASSEELSRLGEEINESARKLKSLQDEYSSLILENDEMERTPTNHELEDQLNALEASVEELTTSSKRYRKALGKAADLPAKPILDEKLKYAAASLRKRKRVCLQIIRHMTDDERCRLSREEILEAIGIEPNQL